VLAAVMAPELVQAYEGFPALRAARGDFLVSAGLRGGRQDWQSRQAVCADGAPVRVVRFVVHLHGLRILERLVASFLAAPKRAPVLDQVHGDLRCLDIVVDVLHLLQPLHDVQRHNKSSAFSVPKPPFPPLRAAQTQTKEFYQKA
jgi:hypothetical protein